MQRTLPFLAATAAVAALAGCTKHTEPPGTPNVCYHVVYQKDGSLKYNKLVTADSFERCAANLEAMRIKFLTMGGNQTEILGAYQGNFIWVMRDGIFSSTSLEGNRYVALVRANGQLVVPGAIAQPPAQ